MLTSGIGWPCVAYEFVRKGGNGISNRLSNILKAPLSSVYVDPGQRWKRLGMEKGHPFMYVRTYIEQFLLPGERSPFDLD